MLRFGKLRSQYRSTSAFSARDRQRARLATAAKVVISSSNNPYTNLALESWHLRNTPAEQPTLLLWRNSPCVVIGRNQNPWAECDLAHMRANSVQLVRRQSGGGAVFHDLGNSVFTLLLPAQSPMATRAGGCNMLISAVNQAPGNKSSWLRATKTNDVEAEVKGSWRKVSGSAYRITSARFLHHATVLRNANLDLLRSCLRGRPELRGAAVASRPAHVANLNDHDVHRFTHETLASLLRAAFERHVGMPTESTIISEQDALRLPGVAEEAARISSPEWIYGVTPDFCANLNIFGAVIRVLYRHGKLAEFELDSGELTDIQNESFLLAIRPLCGAYFTSLEELEATITATMVQTLAQNGTQV